MLKREEREIKRKDGELQRKVKIWQSGSEAEKKREILYSIPTIIGSIGQVFPWVQCGVCVHHLGDRTQSTTIWREVITTTDRATVEVWLCAYCHLEMVSGESNRLGTPIPTVVV